jgi:aryl-alcohol dehydrogenase-like predicted oxidoreductase
MQYTQQHGYAFSKLTLGTVALGIDYGISNKKGKPDVEESVQILAAALRAGINSFDTARTYGSAEQLIGNFFSGRDDYARVNIITKFKISPECLSDRKVARKQAFDSVLISRQRLKLERIPVCLFHMDRDLPQKHVVEIIPEIFEDLKAEGLIDLAGISVDHPDEVGWWADYPLVDVMQIPMNVFDQRLIRNGRLQYLKAAGKIVFVRSIFLQGLFFLTPEQLKGNLFKAAPYLKDLQALASQETMTTAELAFTYIRDLPEITSIVFGADHRRQVIQNADLLNGRPMSAQAREAAGRMFADLPEDIITPRYWNV